MSFSRTSCQEETCSVLYSPDQPELYQRLLKDALPEWDIACWPDEVDVEAVTHVAAWKPPAGFFKRFPEVEVVFVMGAGVDKFLQRDDLAEQVKIVRLTDAGMAQQMTEYCLYGVLHYQRQMDVYLRQQRAGQWLPLPARLASEVRARCSAWGSWERRSRKIWPRWAIGSAGWSRQSRQIDGVACVHGDDGLRSLLPETDVLFCVLPETPETRHLLDDDRLALLPGDAAIINAGRGSLIDQDALLAHLDRGAAFRPARRLCRRAARRNHRLWQHPRVLITPHVAAETLPAQAVDQIAANLRALAKGLSVAGLVDYRRRGY